MEAPDLTKKYALDHLRSTWGIVISAAAVIVIETGIVAAAGWKWGGRDEKEIQNDYYLMENLGSWVSSRPELNRSTSGKASLSEALSSLPFSWEISQGHGGSGGGFSTANI